MKENKKKEDKNLKRFTDYSKWTFIPKEQKEAEKLFNIDNK